MGLPAADAGVFSRSSMPALPWPSLRASPSKPSPAGRNVTERRSGACAAVTSGAGSKGSCWTNRVWGVRRRFPPLQRAQIVELACLEPSAEGLHLTHWTPQDLARQPLIDGIAGAISPRPVPRSRDWEVLQRHRTR